MAVADTDGGEDVVVEASGREVTVSNPNKVFFAERGETKLDLVQLLPQRWRSRSCAAMGGRPTMLQRFPDGAGGSRSSRSGCRRARRSGWRRRWWRRRTAPRPTPSCVADSRTCVWAVNLGCLGFHPWPYMAADPDHADELRIDLDPQPGRRLRPRPRGRRTGSRRCSTSSASGVTPRPRATAACTSTSGSSPAGTPTRCGRRRSPWPASSSAATRTSITAAWWKEERGDRVFVDFNQNAPHKTVFGAWSVRARAGAQVSTPFTWEELDDDPPRRPHHRHRPGPARGRATRGARMHDDRQSLEPLLALHEADRAAGLHDAPWPPVYPKQPNEPPRVAPSRAKKA